VFTVQLKTASGGLCKQVADLPAISRQKVLVVDDNATNRRIVSRLLEQWQMKVTVAHDGHTAISEWERARAGGTPFDIVILDALMPEMDGFEVAERIRLASDEQPLILMLSSTDAHSAGLRCRQLGIDAHLVKPVSRTELYAALLRSLRLTQHNGAEEGGLINLSVATDLAPVIGKKRILLTEDNPVNQKLACRILEKAGYTVVVAGNGREALAELDRSTFDVVLMDVQMPELGGYETVQILREKERLTGQHVSVIALTAHAMKGDRERCLAAGMDDYISKPIRRGELLSKILEVGAHAPAST
jgi:CheY-like chemotaxis protein